VSKEAIKIESDIWNLRNERRWSKFPFEQKVISEKIIPQYKERIIIHDPYILNCIEKFHQVQDAIFVHLCSRTEDFRNKFMCVLLNRKQIKEDRLISEYSEYKDIISKII
jgi:endonuclease IV